MSQTDSAEIRLRVGQKTGSDLSALPPWRANLSWAALLWERLWLALWPSVGLIGFYLLLGLFGLPQTLPGWVHAALLAALAVAVLVSLWRAFRSLRLPSRHAALRRIERVNDLEHRPLESIEDALGTGHEDAASRSLWELHQARLRAAVARLRIGWPRPGLIRRDPYALRVGLGVALIAAFTSTGDEAWERIRNAFNPDIGGIAAAAPVKLDAWISPPEYTRQAPVFLTRDEREGAPPVAAPKKIKVPEGSKLVLRLSGGREAPQLVMPGVKKALDREEKGGFHLEETLVKSGHVSVMEDERELAGWNITVIPDQPPTVAFTRDPGPTARKSLRIDFAAHDDYGVQKVVAKIIGPSVLDPDSLIAKLAPTEIELTLPGQKLRDVKATSFHDLTPHPWAGLPVELQLVAQDALGQLAVSKAVQLVLPERIFKHPVARAIIEQRRQLALSPEKNRGRVAAMLEIIAWEHERYGDDYAVFLALNSASKRLGPGYENTVENLGGVLKLLWDTALHIEDGTLSLSEQSLRDAQQALKDALSNDKTSDAEIERLMRQFEKALNEYMNSLAEMMRKNPDLQRQLPTVDRNAKVLTPEDLKKMMDQIRNLARSGQRDAARQMLSQLQQMLENLRMRRFAQPNQQQQRAMKMLNDLQNIIKQQQQLLDKTFREAQKRGQMRKGNQSQMFPPNVLPPGLQPQPPGSRETPPLSNESKAQEALRRRLGELMRQLGDMSGNIPRPLGRAERSMRQSTQQLTEGQAGQAVPPQTEAIDQLQQGARAATQQLMKQLSRGGAMRRPGPGRPTGEAPDRDRDPFGRDAENAGRGMNTENVKIPDHDKTQEARRIRDELRRRAADRQRPVQELDYIDRLLQEF